MSDDFLDDLDFGPATKKVFKHSAGPRRKQDRPDPSPPPDYYTIPGGGATYDARGGLKALGGFWDADAYCWYVPQANRTEANRVLNEATIVKSLHQGNPDAMAAALAQIAGAQAAGIKGAPSTLCWECGGPLYRINLSDNRAAHFRTASSIIPMLLAGAVVEDRYCGCVERGEKPAAVGRPDFRKR